MVRVGKVAQRRNFCLLLQMGATPFGGLGAPNMEQIAAMGIPGPNMNPQVGICSVTPIDPVSCNNSSFKC